MAGPAATFAIPCRNGAGHLRPLLESLRAQTCQDFALLLVDDGSTDGSADIAREVCGGGIAIHRNATPLGLIANFNRCASLVHTPFFCLAHADDVYAETYLERLLAALAQNPAAGFAHCHAGAIDADGQPYDAPAERFKTRFWRGLSWADAAQHFQLLFGGNYIVCPTALFRTEAFAAVGGFHQHLKYAADWDLWFRFVLAGRLPCGVDAQLFRYRRHDGSATRVASRALLRYREELEILSWARRAGAAAGLLPPTARPFALRNSLLQDAGSDLLEGERAEAAEKLAFLREHAPELFGHPTVRAFRVLVRLGAPGRLLLRAARAMALRLAHVP